LEIHVHEAASASDTTVSQRLDQLETLTKQIAGAVNALIEQSAILAEKVETLSAPATGEPSATETNHGVVEKNITPPKQRATT
jgi:hypothetical protein